MCNTGIADRPSDLSYLDSLDPPQFGQTAKKHSPLTSWADNNMNNQEKCDLDPHNIFFGQSNVTLYHRNSIPIDQYKLLSEQSDFKENVAENQYMFSPTDINILQACSESAHLNENKDEAKFMPILEESFSEEMDVTCRKGSGDDISSPTNLAKGSSTRSHVISHSESNRSRLLHNEQKNPYKQGSGLGEHLYESLRQDRSNPEYCKPVEQSSYEVIVIKQVKRH